MPSRVVEPTGTENNADLSLGQKLIPFGGVLGYRSPNLDLAVGNFAESLKNLDDQPLVLLSLSGHEWDRVDAEVMGRFGQTASRYDQWRTRGSLAKDSVTSFEVASNEYLRSGWITYVFGQQDDNTTGTGIWILQTKEYRTPSPEGPVSDALSTLEQIAPSDKNDLEDLLELPLNWDREGGLPATEQAVIEAARLIVELYTKSQRKLDVTSLTAAIDGGVEFTLEGLDGRELFLVIPSSGTNVRFVISLPIDSGSYEDTAGFLGSDRSLDSLINDLVLLG